VTIVSEEFAAMGAATAREHGFAGLPLLTVEQPFDRLLPDRVRAIASELVGDVVHCLTAAAVELEEEFSGRWLDGLMVDACFVSHER
jgi:hypothetical protein